MKIFGKLKEELRVSKVKATRALYGDGTVQEVEIKLKVEDGNTLILLLHPDVAASLIQQTTQAYEAIRPPLVSGRWAATWQGMDDDH